MMGYGHRLDQLIRAAPEDFAGAGVFLASGAS
jgi:hypothetical protein